MWGITDKYILNEVLGRGRVRLHRTRDRSRAAWFVTDPLFINDSNNKLL